MADYQMEGLCAELNEEAAKLARACADKWSALTPDKPRYVAGVLGPTNRTASISPDVNDPAFRNISFDTLVMSYREAICGLIKGGVDLIMVETIFDTLNAKAAIFAIKCEFDNLNIELPESNPFGLALDCYDGTPQRLEAVIQNKEVSQ